MVSFKIFDINIAISYFFLSVLSILIIIDKSGMLSISLLAVLFHELGHLVMMRILKVTVSSIEFSLATVKVTTVGIINHINSLLIALAGPMVNLILSSLLFTRIAILEYFGAANLIMFIFNMIPAKGLDGGDALQYLLLSLKIKNNHSIYEIISIISIGFIIFFGGILFYITKSNITLIFVGIYLFILSFKKI